MEAAPTHSGEKPNAEEGTPLAPGSSSASLQITPEQSLEAARLLENARKNDRPIVLQILRQGGFDVCEINALASGQSANAGDDCIEEFCRDVLTRAQWDLLPFQFVRELLNAWLAIRYPDVPEYSQLKMKRALMPVVGKYGWVYPENNTQGQSKRYRPSDRMNAPDPMIKEFELKAWYNFDPDSEKTYARQAPWAVGHAHTSSTISIVAIGAPPSA